jgi:peptidoglycan/xylan/chitin deacetylase (PgdA/CDA1 family)
MSSTPTQRLSSRVLSRIPLTLLRSIVRVPLIVPYYHMISDDDVWHVKHLYAYKDVRRFTNDLEFLLRSYSPIDLLELLAHMREGRSLPPNAFLLTFDDGFREMLDVVAPILIAKGVRATFFVNSDFIDNARLCYLNKASVLVEHLRRSRSDSMRASMSSILRARGITSDDPEAGILSVRYRQRDVLDEIARAAEVDFDEYLRLNRPYLTTGDIQQLIASGFGIGGHSVDHPLYALLPLDEQIRQTVESVTEVRRRFELPYGAFAFPHGDHKVSREYFERIAESGLVDVSFGTAGLLNDCVPNHIQRINLENPPEPAQRTVAFQHARRLGKMMTTHATIARQ